MEVYTANRRKSRLPTLFCESTRPESQFTGLYRNLKSNRNVPVVAVSTQFVATSARGLSGSFSILPIQQTGVVPFNDPVVSGHSNIITDLAFSPFDKQLLASASADKKICVWKIPLKGLVADLTDPHISLDANYGVDLIRFHPTVDKLILSASADEVIRLWDIEKGIAMYELAEKGVKDVVFNYFGSSFLVASSANDVKICDARNRGGESLSLPETRGTSIVQLGESNIVMTVSSTKQSTAMKFWDPRSSNQPVKEIQTSLCSAATTLTPLFDIETRLLYVTDKNLKSVFVYDVCPTEFNVDHVYTYKSTTATKSLAMVPKRALDIAHCELARIMKLSGDSIEPLSFTLPFSGGFSEAFYPPAFAGHPSWSKEEWIIGSDADDLKHPPVLKELMEEFNETEKRRNSLLNQKPLLHLNETMAMEEDEDESSDDNDYFSAADGEEKDESEDEDPLLAADRIEAVESLPPTPFLKFGRRGSAHEKSLRLEESRYVIWRGSYFSLKAGVERFGKLFIHFFF